MGDNKLVGMSIGAVTGRSLAEMEFLMGLGYYSNATCKDGLNLIRWCASVQTIMNESIGSATIDFTPSNENVKTKQMPEIIGCNCSARWSEMPVRPYQHKRALLKITVFFLYTHQSILQIQMC
jgi:hypothetical protein